MILRSLGEIRHYLSIWLSTVLGAPFVLRRLIVLALIATGARSTERGGDFHGPRMIFPENIGMIFVPYSRRGPAFDLLLSTSLLERMIPGETTLVIKKNRRERGPASLDSGACLVL